MPLEHLHLERVVIRKHVALLFALLEIQSARRNGRKMGEPGANLGKSTFQLNASPFFAGSGIEGFFRISPMYGEEANHIARKRSSG